MTSRLYAASCFGSIPSTANADLKQPLLEVQDLETSSSSSQEDQKTDNARQRLSILRSVLLKSFCYGSFLGLLVQSITFSAVFVMAKKWGKNPPPEASANVSYWTLCLLAKVDIVVYSMICGCFCMAVTRKGSMYMLKKFDNDADAPDTESIWTPRLLFHSEIVFLLGFLAGSYTAFAVIDIGLGKPLPLTLLIFTLLMDVGTCFLMLTCFEMVRREPTAYDDEPEEEDNEDLYFV
jgi:hypothetical protein